MPPPSRSGTFSSTSRPPGAPRIRLRRQREVVAFASGVLVESAPLPPDAQSVRFDPYRAASFLLPDGRPISAAALVAFLPDGSCWAVPHLECPHA
ncbi:hypothetical protein [Methylorubrum extorquens]|uniref:hypothetical protein n=1 Tax=Methylorubrum extorquens TaxID=408 RepID=UPI004058F40F